MARTYRRSTGILLVIMLAATLLFMSVVPGPAAAKRAAKTPSIVDVAIAVNASGAYAGQFDTLIAAVLAADPAVVQTLSSRAQYTVFAPTDDAFAKLGLDAGNISTVPQADLTNILLYHVAYGRRYAADVIASDQIRMLNGGFVFQSGGVLTDAQGGTSTIIVTDVKASNGVIHAIDSVLLP
jgi:uncharacterized surface protein with fasciclin (FAS1) repeats